MIHDDSTVPDPTAAADHPARSYGQVPVEGHVPQEERVPQEGQDLDPISVQAMMEGALFELKRVIVGQDAMLERVLVALLAGGHVLLEGVPGLAKTLTIRTLARVLGGTFRRVQFTPDLVPADIVGTRVYRPDTGTFVTEPGPVLCNYLLADEINRAPAKVQSALLEVMQERQVTIGGQTLPVPAPFLVLATQNPIEAEGTYPLPEAQLDRFLLKVLVGYPDFPEELAVVQRSLGDESQVRRVLDAPRLLAAQRAARGVYVDRAVQEYAVALAMATRHPRAYGLEALAPYLAFGASPRGSIALVHAARARALLRGRAYALPQDVRALAKDVLRHRLVLTYDALAETRSPDDLLDQVLAAVPLPRIDFGRGEADAPDGQPGQPAQVPGRQDGRVRMPAAGRILPANTEQRGA